MSSTTAEVPDAPPSWLSESERLHARVRDAIAAGGPSTAEDFDRLGLEIAAFQVEYVEPVRRLARARGFDAGRATSLCELPALPVDAFKLRRVAAHPAEHDERVFRTSGTTQGAERRGEHPLRTLETYRTASIAWALRHLDPTRSSRQMLVLAPSSTELRDSSLSFMIDEVAAELGLSPTHLVSPSQGLDLDGFEAHYARAREANAAVLLLGTSFAYVYLLDALGLSRRPLPQGSTAMITGGFKGKTREVPEAELRAQLSSALELPPTRVVGEYGMTELSSQLWEPSLEGGLGRYRAPPWLRVEAVDPSSLEPLPPGEVGIARFVDLANVDGAIAVLTADRVRVVEGEVELLGRAPGAPPRGCSLAIEELMQERG